MIDAISVTAGAMIGDMERLNAISHNLANSATTGFKREVLVSRPFAEYLSIAGADGRSLAINLGQTQSVIDHKPGTLKFSGNPFDLAIQEDGYFEVMTETGPAYTRQGSFRLDAQGRLVTETGLPVSGNSGELTLATSQPSIRPDGRIFDGERELGTLKVVRFESDDALRHIGGGLYIASESATVADGLSSVRQGYVETSNVNGMTEMVKLIETMRHFETGQRVMQAYGDMMDKAISTLGQF